MQLTAPPTAIGQGVGLSFVRRRSGAPFTPLSPSSALAIWEGDKNVVGSPVTSWTDTKAGISATASGSLRPTTGTVNGKSCPLFSTGLTALTIPTFALLGAKTIVVGAQMTVVPSAGAVFYSPLTLKDTGGSFCEFTLFNNAGYKNVTYIADASGATNGRGYNPTLDLLSHDYSMTWDASSQTTGFAMSLDNAVQTPIASGAFNRTAADLGAIGGRLTSVLGITQGLMGYVMYIYVYGSVLSAPVLAQINSYNVAKWGV